MREHRLDLGLLKSFALLGQDLSGMDTAVSQRVYFLWDKTV